MNADERLLKAVSDISASSPLKTLDRWACQRVMRLYGVIKIMVNEENVITD